jgi:hypothetical protein
MRGKTTPLPWAETSECGRVTTFDTSGHTPGVEESVRQAYERGKPMIRDAVELGFCSYCGSLRCGCHRLVFGKTSRASGVAETPATASVAAVGGRGR